MNHLELVLEAKAAIGKLGADTSVSRADTIVSLQEILEDLEGRIETLIYDEEEEDENLMPPKI